MKRTVALVTAAIAVAGLLVADQTPLNVTASPATALDESRSFNPNNFDTAKVVEAINRPKADLVTLSTHRGLHALVDGSYPEVPENSLEAIGLAAQEGLEMLELDIKLTRDGVPVLSHDVNWGRQTDYGMEGPEKTSFDPFVPPNPANDRRNPPVSSLTLREIQSTAMLRDSITYTTSNERVSSLEEVLDYIKEKRIAMALSLDIRDTETAAATWAVISRKTDYVGRSYADSTLFKIVASVYPTPADFKAGFAFGPGHEAVNYWPVYNTGDIAPDKYGSEANIIDHLRTFRADPTITVSAVEIQIKQDGGILSDLLSYAKTNPNTGEPASVTVFSPYIDYYEQEDPEKEYPVYYKTTGYCCVPLSDFYYDGSPNGQQSDTQDNRVSFDWVNGAGFNSITTDNPADFASRLAALGKRNLSHMTGNPVPPIDPLPAPERFRIMPLGDSITFGDGSSTGNGYRSALKEDLTTSATTKDIEVNFVGSVRSGTMNNNDNEGHSGWTIDQVGALVGTEVKTRAPSVIALHLGTNDMRLGHGVDEASGDLQRVIDDIFREVPDTTLLLATLVPSTNPAWNAGIQEYNKTIRLLSYYNMARPDPRRIQLVEMSRVTLADLEDDLHPNDSGYQKMADAFSDGIHTALANGWIENRPEEAGSGQPGPLPSAGTWVPQDTIATGVGALWNAETMELRFGDLDGDGRQDYLVVDRATGVTRAWLNRGGVRGSWNWVDYGVVATGVGAAAADVRFADLDGDGKDDYLVLNPGNGSVRAWVNKGGTPGAWNWAPYELVATGVAEGHKVQFADLNGDGLDDYLVVDRLTGAVNAWVNSGGGTPGNWHWKEYGLVATGVADGSKVKFADINSDGWDDYIVLEPANGSLTAWVNRGGAPGHWDWAEQGQIAPGVGPVSPNHRVEIEEINGDGKADYLVIAANGTIQGWLNNGNDASAPAAWISKGIVAVGVGADPRTTELKWGDINGDGRDDYLVVNKTSGAVRAWINNPGGSVGSVDQNTVNSLAWQDLGTVFSREAEVTGNEVHFADLDGDGMDDYLVVNPRTGVVKAFINIWTAERGFVWVFIGTVASGVGTGVGLYEARVRFADIDGDGDDDYLAINRGDGTVKAWINAGAGGPNAWNWSSSGVLATGVGARGNSVRFGDFDGDGRDDYLVVNADGSVDAWRNMGGELGAWNWVTKGKVAPGIGISFIPEATVDINGDGRVDYLKIESNGSVRAWVNNSGIG